LSSQRRVSSSVQPGTAKRAGGVTAGLGSAMTCWGVRRCTVRGLERCAAAASAGAHRATNRPKVRIGARINRIAMLLSKCVPLSDSRSASKRDPSERVVPVVHMRDPPPERSGSARSVAEGGGVFSARITPSIAKLDDEHLLDLHDIFRFRRRITPRRHGLGGDAQMEPSARNERLTTAIGHRRRRSDLDVPARAHLEGCAADLSA
jgi:hypothetical protein